MAALHPETVRLLRGVLENVTEQHRRDILARAKYTADSRSSMAAKLSARITESKPVIHDLEQLVPSGTLPAPTELQTAYRVLGDVMDTMPADFVACGWDIDVRYSTGTRIKIQQSLYVHSADGVRQGIRSVATVLGLTYAEDRRKGRIVVTAAGEIDGIRVEVWDAIETTDGAR